MDNQEYLKNRVDDQIDWYDKKSKWNQNWFKALRILSVTFAVFIPFITGLIEPQNEYYLKIIIGLLGVLIAIIEGVMALYKFHENWIQYRTTSESLKHNKYLFLTSSGQYSDSNAFELFVINIENLISKENSNWKDYLGQSEINKN